MKFFAVLFLCAVAIACVSAEDEIVSIGGTSLIESVVAQVQPILAQLLAAIQDIMKQLNLEAIIAQIQSFLSILTSRVTGVLA